MTTGKEFTVEQLPDTPLRVAYCSPVELLALNAQSDFDKYAPTLTVITYALEHVEAYVNGKWVAVKQKDHDVYMPLGIENNLAALNAIAVWFITNVVAAVFHDSDK